MYSWQSSSILTKGLTWCGPSLFVILVPPRTVVCPTNQSHGVILVGPPTEVHFRYPYPLTQSLYSYTGIHLLFPCVLPSLKVFTFWFYGWFYESDRSIGSPCNRDEGMRMTFNYLYVRNHRTEQKGNSLLCVIDP